MTGTTVPEQSVKAESAAIERAAYVWNTAAGLLNAFQSVIMLIVLSHVCDPVQAGVFTIAYANANLFLNLGKYGVRNFQVSDVDEKYDFRAYHAARVASTLAMVVCGVAWSVWSALGVGYTLDKFLVMVMMVLFKAIDAYEDVFHGNYQQHGRLDVGAKVLTLRMASMIVVFAGLIIVTRDLLLSLTAATVFTALFFVAETLWARRAFELPVQRSESPASPAAGARGLLKECFPVFLATFLLFYIGNAPKYAIDAVMDDVAQAQYGYIAMPVFVVGLLAFARRFALQTLIIVGITLVCMAGAWILGVPVLNLLYNTELAPYKTDLLVLLAGGGFLAMATLFTTGLTIIRWQNKLIPGYVIVAALALVTCPPAVQAAGIDGASWVYLGLMAILTVWFGIVFALGIRRA